MLKMTASLENASSTVPAFLTKLWRLVDEEETDELICWDPSGQSFHVFDQGRFAKEILPMYFKHSNIASFIRQLNMYGFRKVAHVEHGGLKVEKDDMEFTHQYFMRGQEQLLELIKRKVSAGGKSGGGGDDVKVKPNDVYKVLNDVQTMKGKQENYNAQFASLKKENEALWQEIASLRSKHQKQQAVVNKLIHFLVSLVGGQRGLGSKRKMPLMITDTHDGPSAAKVRHLQTPPLIADGSPPGIRIHEVLDGSPSPIQAPVPSGSSAIPELQTAVQPYSVEQVDSATLDGLDSILEAETTLQQPQPNVFGATAAGGSGLGNTGAIMGQQLPVETTATASSSSGSLGTVGATVQPPAPVVIPPNMLVALQQPSTSVSRQPGDLSRSVANVSAAASTTTTSTDTAMSGGQGLVVTTELPLAQSAALPSPKIMEVMEHVDGMQTNLDVLKEMLSGDGYSLPLNTIHGLFNPEGPVPRTPDPNMLFGNIGLDQIMEADSGANNTTDVMGNELVSYDPNNDSYSSLFELADPVLGDDSIDLLTEGPIGLSGQGVGSLAAPGAASTLNTPEVGPTTPGLSISSALANKRKRRSPARIEKKTESVD